MDTNIINELTQGKELAMHLKSILSSESSSETKDVLIQQIISSYDRAILMVNWGDSGGQTPLTPRQPDSSVSFEESQDFNQPFDSQQDDKDESKKRKAMPTWRNQIRISTENGLEGNTDDGYSWRKYGQKDILGSKFPRSYYRCTYRYVHHCMARKQVQRTDEDPTVFEIIYKGEHSCKPTAAAEKHDHQIEQNNPLVPLPSQSGGRLTNSDHAMVPACSFSFPSASIENHQQSHLLTDYNGDLRGVYSTSFISPATSGSNYFQHHHDDSGRTATTSATDSPFADPQSFPFDNSGYFI